MRYCVPFSNFQDGIEMSFELPPSSIFPPQFKTKQLVFKRLTTTQLRQVYHLTKKTPNSVFEKCWWKSYQNPHTLNEHIREIESKHTHGERAEYVIYEKNNTETAIGVCHLTPDLVNGIGKIGIWLHPDYWGNEYAVEQSIASISIFFECFDIPVVQAWCTKDNSNSKRTLQKIFTKMGGKCEGCVRRGYWEDKIIFSITEDEYFKRTSDPPIITTLEQTSTTESE